MSQLPCADYSTYVLSKQSPIVVPIEEAVLTYDDVDCAWKNQTAAVDRWEWLILHGSDEGVCEQAWEDMQEATRIAMDVESTYHDQYQRRQWLTNGRWTVKPLMGA